MWNVSELWTPKAPTFPFSPSTLREAGDFSQTSGLVTIPIGTLQQPGRVVVCSRTIPGGSAALLEKWSAKVIDQGNSDQVYFSLMRNGSQIAFSQSRVPGIEFDNQGQIGLNQRVYAGDIAIVAFNISGMSPTIEPDALTDAVTIRCQAWWSGTLLSERGGFK